MKRLRLHLVALACLALGASGAAAGCIARLGGTCCDATTSTSQGGAGAGASGGFGAGVTTTTSSGGGGGGGSLPVGQEPWQGGPLTAAWLESDERFGIASVQLGWTFERCSSSPAQWSPDFAGPLEPAPVWADAPAVGGRYPWDGHGVTAGWATGGARVVISVDRYWVLDEANGTWTGSGLLAETWADLPPVDGFTPFEGAGVTAGWVDPASGNVVVASEHRYWALSPGGTTPADYSLVEQGLLQDRARWSDVPAVEGQLPWDGPGVTAGWYDPARHVLGIVSRDRYWLMDTAAASPSRWQWVSTGMLENANPLSRVEGLTVISYNIASAMSGVYGHPGAMLDKLASFIHEHRADVVGLQEVDVGTDRHAGVDMPALLLSELSGEGYPMHGIFANRFNVSGGQFGVMLLSRAPLDDHQAHVVYSGTVAQAARTSLSCAGAVRPINYHPYPNHACDSASGYLTAINTYSSEMTILVGDFNAGPGGCGWTEADQAHTDVCAAVGEPSCDNSVDISWHPGHPEVRIDHIFHRESAAAPFAGPWRGIWAFIDQDINDGLDVSDHYPVIARIIYEAPEPG